MEVVKRNIYSIICGVFAIIAVVLVFYPLGGWFEDLQAKLNESGTDYTTARSLLSKEHTAPSVDIENAEQRKMDRFPTPKVIQAGEAAVTKVQDQSLALLAEAMKMNQKDPLVPTALPVQRNGAAFSDFKIEYYGRLRDFVRRLNAINAPTQEDVERRIEAFRRENQQTVGGDFGRGDFEADMQMREMTIPDEMAKERAERGSIYVSADVGGTGAGGLSGDTPELSGLRSFDVHHPGIPTPSQQGHPTIVDVWAAQLGLWVQHDIVDAIVATNGTNPGIANSVVKRLIEIKVPKEYVTKLGRVALTDSTTGASRYDPNAAPAADGSAPVEAVEDPSKPPKDPKQSATGRISNPLYDVVHFTVTVDADATRFREFMAKLVSNRHITILAVDLEGVDRDTEFQALYLYGDKPVVRVRLTCEALMFRKWTLPLMPEPVKKMLNITPPVEGGMPETVATP